MVSYVAKVRIIYTVLKRQLNLTERLSPQVTAQWQGQRRILLQKGVKTVRAEAKEEREFRRNNVCYLKRISARNKASTLCLLSSVMLIYNMFHC